MKNTAHPVDRTANWCSHGGWFTLAIKLYFVGSTADGQQRCCSNRLETQKLLAQLIGCQEFLCVRALHFMFGQGSPIRENIKDAILFYFSYLVESAELQMAHSDFLEKRFPDFQMLLKDRQFLFSSIITRTFQTRRSTFAKEFRTCFDAGAGCGLIILRVVPTVGGHSRPDRTSARIDCLTGNWLRRSCLSRGVLVKEKCLVRHVNLS